MEEGIELQEPDPQPSLGSYYNLLKERGSNSMENVGN